MENSAYLDAVAQTLTLADFERSKHSPHHSIFHLDRMRLLCEELGNPQSDIPSIHIAGTKGKGTTSAMITSVLGFSGYKVGLITSPHLHTLTERIRIGFDPIPEQDFVDLVQQMWPSVLEVGENGQFGGITWFEFMVSAAFSYFSKCKVDFQVVETGLGGRLDATNIILPIVSIITSISLDHTGILGDTLSKIAAEKSGIIKEGIPIIVSPQRIEPMGVIVEAADKLNAPLKKVTDEYEVVIKNQDLSGQSIKVISSQRNYEFTLPLLGIHQTENAITAICAIETLQELGYPISRDSVELGLSNVCWPGRFEVLKDSNPVVIVDGAHNPYSIQTLVNTLDTTFENPKVIIIFGAIGGHDVDRMLEPLKSLDVILIPVSSRHPKSIDSKIIKKASISSNIETTQEFKTVGEGLEYALKVYSDRDLILATGSLSVVAEVSEVLKQISPEIYPDLP